MAKTEKVREILRNIGIEMFDVFMEDEAKKQKQIEKYNKQIDELDVEAEIEELDKQAEKNADLYGFNNNAVIEEENNE